MQEEHYYPFGLNQVGDWYATTAPENKYQFNGKELNEEMGLNWTDYGARWYDATLGRWGQIDPAASEYSNLSPYNYVANNPILLVDPDGTRIDVSALLNNGNGGVNKDGIWLLANLIWELNAITGMQFRIENGNLVENKEIKARTEGTSKSARDYVRGVIGDDKVVNVKVGENESFAADGENVFLSTTQIEGQMNSLEEKGLNSLSYGYGMTFLHESLHTYAGAKQYGESELLHDPNPFGEGTSIAGPVEEKVNVFRQELRLPQRLQYSDFPRGLRGIGLEWQKPNGEKVVTLQTSREQYSRERQKWINFFKTNIAPTYKKMISK